MGDNCTNGGTLFNRLSIWSALYLPHTGGVENFTHNIAAALAKRGVRVQVVTSQLGGAPEHEADENGVEIWRLPARNLMGGRLPISQKNAHYKELLDAAAAFSPEAVLVNTRFYAHSVEGLRFAKRVGAKAAVLDHGSAHLVLGNAAADAVLAAYEHAITACVKAYHPEFYGISQKSADWLRHFGIKPTGIIQNAIDAPAFRALASDRDFRAELGVGAEDLLVTFCGRLVPEKGPDKLLDALGRLCGENDALQIKCVFAGDGALRGALGAKAAALAEFAGQRSAFFPGNLKPADLSALLQQSNLFCLPTRSEGFCTSLLEASACGVPSLITDVGGARELIPDDTCGFILSSADAPAVAAGLREAASLGLPALAAMGACAREHVEAVSSWGHTADAVMAAFE